jgi:hypothetical protein
MSKRLTELEDDRDAGKPGAEQRLASFITERTHLVDSIVQVSSILLPISETHSSTELRRIGEMGQGGSRGPNP